MRANRVVNRCFLPLDRRYSDLCDAQHIGSLRHLWYRYPGTPAQLHRSRNVKLMVCVVPCARDLDVSHVWKRLLRGRPGQRNGEPRYMRDTGDFVVTNNSVWWGLWNLRRPAEMAVVFMATLWRHRQEALIDNWKSVTISPWDSRDTVGIFLYELSLNVSRSSPDKYFRWSLSSVPALRKIRTWSTNRLASDLEYGDIHNIPFIHVVVCLPLSFENLESELHYALSLPHLALPLWQISIFIFTGQRSG